MKKKILSIFLTSLFVGLMMTGCKQNVGTPEDNPVVDAEETEETEEEPGYVFGYSSIDLENDYFNTLGLAMEDALGEEGRIIYSSADTDTELQKQQIQEFIEQGVDAVFLTPVDWKEIGFSLEALEEAGIPVINLDTQVKDSDKIAAFIGSNNKNAGMVCGEDLIERCPDGGKILILECTDRNAIIERINGFEKVIANSGFEVLNRADGRGDRETAKELMKEFLTQYPEIDAVMCGNDTMALGVMEAVKEAGREGILIYGIDGSPEVKSEIAKADGMITATAAQSPIDMGKAAVEAALKILNGEEFKEETLTDTFLIDKENIELYGSDGWQ